MSLLSTIAPMLAGGNQFSFNVAEVNGTLRVVTNPTIANFKPDTTDGELAAIQSALVMPVVLTIPLDGRDLDAALAELLQQAQALRQPNLDRLAAYNDAQREAQNAAQLAKDKKAIVAKPPAAKPPAAKPAKAGAKPGAAGGLTVGSVAGDATDATDGDDAADEGAEAAAQDEDGENAAAADEATPPPAPAATANLFD